MLVALSPACHSPVADVITEVEADALAKALLARAVPRRAACSRRWTRWSRTAAGRLDVRAALDELDARHVRPGELAERELSALLTGVVARRVATASTAAETLAGRLRRVSLAAPGCAPRSTPGRRRRAG